MPMLLPSFMGGQRDVILTTLADKQEPQYLVFYSSLDDSGQMCAMP
jgi:hypothetical protein